MKDLLQDFAAFIAVSLFITSFLIWAEHLS